MFNVSPRLKRNVEILVLALLLVTLGTVIGLRFFSHKSPYRVITLEDQSTVTINLPIFSDIMSQIQLEVLAKDRFLPAGAPMYIYINSPGGEVDTGLQFISMLRGLKRPIHTVSQFSASMAFMTAQFLDDRYITPFGTMMAHPISLEGLGGQIPGSLVSRFNWLLKESNDLNDRVARRIGVDAEHFKNELLSEIWITGEDAVDRNFADEIVLPKCGTSMVGTYTRVVTIMGFRLAVEFSKCPLVVEPVGIKPADPVAPPAAKAKSKKLTRDQIINELLESARKKRGDKVFFVE